MKKSLPNTLFPKSKVPYKKKKINHSTVYTLKTNYYLKYLCEGQLSP